MHRLRGGSRLKDSCKKSVAEWQRIPLISRLAENTPRSSEICRVAVKAKFAVAGCVTICDNIVHTMFYSRIARVTVASAAVMVALALFGERQPLDRYQSIIDRQMFGPLPPNFDPTKSPSEISAKDARAQEQELSKEQEQVKSAIHFSVINVTPAGDTAVGFTDNSDTKNPKHYYLKVGESRDGWTVKEADPLAASMTIAKGEIEVSLTIGGNSASGGGTKKTGAAANGARSTSASRPSLLGARIGSASSGGRGLGSLRERRALREQQRAADAKAAAEEREKAAEKEAQREAERAAEKEQREKEREEQRAQLMQIQEELRKAREERDKKSAEEGEKKDEDAEKEGDGES